MNGVSQSRCLVRSANRSSEAPARGGDFRSLQFRKPLIPCGRRLKRFKRGLTNSIGSPLSPGQTCYHQVPKHLCHAAVADLVRSRNCHYASRGVGRIALRD
ncbi:hypothetical protein PIB30_047393 [Stylosanthes scabra]|uniref:Uncharacterized protein n=1 Tax=Stylosanthes scabra TaxID=79078 RepID=A0ABU6QGF7_9FABA|nr:hypothetical protein [Stylosanthes scabra]